MRHFEPILWPDLVILVTLNQSKYPGLLVSSCAALAKESTAATSLLLKDSPAGYTSAGTKGDHPNLAVHSNLPVQRIGQQCPQQATRVKTMYRAQLVNVLTCSLGRLPENLDCNANCETLNPVQESSA